MGGWHHRLNGHEFEKALGDGEGQESLACCSPWGQQRVGRELVTERQQHKNPSVWYTNVCHSRQIILLEIKSCLW